jgi:hypothetical protein
MVSLVLLQLDERAALLRDQPAAASPSSATSQPFCECELEMVCVLRWETFRALPSKCSSGRFTATVIPACGGVPLGLRDLGRSAAP